MMTTSVDMRLPLEILADAIDVARKLDGIEIEDTTLGKSGSATSRDAARLNRALLNLADQLQLASSLVRNVYWDGKGQLSYDL